MIMHRERPENPRLPELFTRRFPSAAETPVPPRNSLPARARGRAPIAFLLVLALSAAHPAAGETAPTATELPPLPETLTTQPAVSGDQAPFSLSEPPQERVDALLSPDISGDGDEAVSPALEDGRSELPPLPEQLAAPSETAVSEEVPASRKDTPPVISPDAPSETGVELPPLPEPESSPTTVPSPAEDVALPALPEMNRSPDVPRPTEGVGLPPLPEGGAPDQTTLSGEAEQGVLVLPPLPPLPEGMGDPFGVALPPIPTTVPEDSRPGLSDQIPLPPLSPFEGTWAVLMKADTSYGKASEAFRLLTLRLEGEQFRVLTGDGASFSVKPAGAERLEGVLSTTQGERVTIRMDLPRGRQDLTVSLLRSGKVIVTLFALPEDMGSHPIPGENAPLRIARERFRTAFEDYLTILRGNAQGDAEGARKKAVMEYLTFQDLATRR
jgi:hypothetical protein